MWGAAGETIEIFEKFCIERSQECGTKSAVEGSLSAPSSLPRPAYSLIFLCRHPISAGRNRNSWGTYSAGSIRGRGDVGAALVAAHFKVVLLLGRPQGPPLRQIDPPPGLPGLQVASGIAVIYSIRRLINN